MAACFAERIKLESLHSAVEPLLAVTCLGLELLEPSWLSVVLQCLAEEPFGRRNIASFAQQEIHCSTLPVNRSIQVRPLTLHPYIGLVTTP